MLRGVTGFQRARQPEQKEARRARLLETARAMLDEGVALRELSLNALARRASMTKSNVYRYFESREAVLLTLLVDEWTAWFDALRATWRPPPAGRDPLDHAVRLLARSLARSPRLCTLTAALPSVLEQNLGEEAILAFKRRSYEFFDEVAAHLCARAPGLSRAAATQLLHDGVAVIVGLHPLCFPAEAAARAQQAPELRGFARRFDRDLERFLGALARDLTAKRARA